MVYQHYGRSLRNLLIPVISEHEEDPKIVLEEAAQSSSLVFIYDPLAERSAFVKLWGVIGLVDSSEENKYSLKSCITIDSAMGIGAMPLFEFSAEEFRTVLIESKYQEAVIKIFDQLYEEFKENINEMNQASTDYKRKKAEREEFDALPLIQRYNLVKGEEGDLLIELEGMEVKVKNERDLRASLAEYFEKQPNYK